jgi:hypothetical protein
MAHKKKRAREEAAISNHKSQNVERPKERDALGHNYHHASVKRRALA